MEQPRARGLLISAGLLLLVGAVYQGIGRHAFIDFDDGEYVYDNPVVRAGLNLAGIRWAFTTTHAANWHPLTWISHMADVQLFGLEAGWHHRVNLLIHLLNTLLLFRLLRGMTGRDGRSAFAAALFGIHPLHVESVAWVAERKDVLAAAFWLLALLAYAAWVRRPRASAYGAALLFFSMGLLSKPTVVTLPFVLLLLDFWPLGRFGEARLRDASGRREFGARLAGLAREKLPFFLLAAAGSLATYLAQSQGRATASAAAFPVGQRLANALVSSVVYLAKTVWPSALGVFYPHPATLGETIAPLQWLAALALLLLLTGVALRLARRHPYLLFGWLWFLGTLVPVIGIVQAGSQARADRYTYIPLIGIFAAASWGGFELLSRLRARRVVFAAAAAAVLAPLAIAARVQAGYWRDATSLYAHTIEVTSGNWLAWNNLGMQSLAGPDSLRAEHCFRRALAAKPDYPDAWYNLGLALGRQARHPEAAACYRRSLELDPRNADGWVNLSIECRTLGDHGRAIDAGERALRIRPSDPLALESLVVSCLARGENARAEQFLARLAAVDPAAARDLEASLNRGHAAVTP